MAHNEPSEDQEQRSALTGIRILDFTRYQQGPFATMLLAEMGAEVIKIEEPGGEPGRANGRDETGFSAYFEGYNRSKKSMTLDLHTDEAREVVRRLIPSCDAVVENFRPDVMERWGLGYEDLKQLRQDIIVGSGSSWGRKGPWANRPGYDHVGQALSGIMYEQGDGPGGEPHALVGGFSDQIGAMLLAFGVSSALVARERFGIGQHVDVSLIAGMTALQSMQFTRFLRTEFQSGFQRRRAATYTNYECADGKHIAIAANTQRFWERMCDALDHPELKTDPRFADPFGRADNKDELVELLSAIFKERPMSAWLAPLTDADVPNAPVLDYAGVVEHPQFWANDYFQEIEHAQLGPMRVPGPPVHMSETPPKIRSGGPELGMHTEELLLEAGYDWDQITRLREAGAI
jgi:crotonobetainyl-CoA:carnitine CoA-transferase CaiB-like acyl-CoA transferase